MTLPDIHQLYDVIDATWPAAHSWTQGPFTFRQGDGGGSRVSATTLNKAATDDDIKMAQRVMNDLGQPLLFMIKKGQDRFDAQLADAGYVIKDPCVLYAAPTTDIAPDAMTFAIWPPLAVQVDIWAKGGVGHSRLAIMDRAKGVKSTVLGRLGEHPAGTVYAGIHKRIAMLHALEIEDIFRRRGLGRDLTLAVSRWAKSQGASHLTLITTQANAGANALYASLGMKVVGHYHYRIKTSE